VGRQLFEALFSGPVLGTYRHSLGAAQQRGEPLRVMLRPTAPQLAALPWEAMFDPETETYICRKEPLLRHVPAPYTREPLEVTPPLRVLVLVASPRGMPALDVAAEQKHLSDALATPRAAGLIELELLAQASWHAVHEKLLSNHWHVVHFIGHGEYDVATDQGLIALVGEGGRADLVEAEQLADLLNEARPTPRLVVLNSCSSGEEGTKDLFSGTAAALVRSGISAVAAIQFTISDPAAIAFAQGFYTAIANGYSIDDATRSGRISILGKRTLEWVTPVLYVRGENTQLFHVIERPLGPTPSPLPAAERRPELVDDPEWIDALSAYFGDRWPEAVERFEALQARYPGEGRVETRLTEARRRRDIDSWSSKAEAAAAETDWDTAVTALENLATLDPSYPDIAARLEQARIAQRRKTLVDEITALHQAGQWQAVVAAAQELARLDPENPDPGGIVSDAQARIRDADFADRYARALNHLAEEDWQQAADLFAAIEQEQPGYRDAAALLTTAQQQRDLAAWSDQAAAAAARDDWDTALTALQKIRAVDPTFRDAGTRLEQTRSAKRLRTLVDEVTALHQAGRWKDVLAAEDELARLDPDHPDPGGMVSDARAKLREATQQSVAAPNSTEAADKSPEHKAPTVPEHSRETAAADRPGTDAATLSGRFDAPTSGPPASTQDRRTASVPPAGTTSRPADLPPSQRLSKKVKIVFVTATMLVAAAVTVSIVVSIITANRSGDPVRRLQALVGSNCSPNPLFRDAAGAVAGVVCSDPEGALSGGVPFYYLFSDRAALDSYYNSNVVSSQPPCPGMVQSPQNWHRVASPQQIEGQVDCVVASDGTPIVSWTVDAQLLFGSASGPKGGTIDQVYQWWAKRYQVCISATATPMPASPVPSESAVPTSVSPVVSEPAVSTFTPPPRSESAVPGSSPAGTC